MQVNVKKHGSSTFYETEGKGQSSLVAHLKVDKDCPDPYAKMLEDLNSMTKDIQKKEPKKLPGTRLLEKEGVIVTLNKKEQKVTVNLTIDISTEGEVSSKLFNLISEVNKCFVINQKKLRPTT